MSSHSPEALRRLQEASSSGASLAGSLYAYRPISRAVPPLSGVQSPLKLCRSLCLLFEEECRLFQEVKKYGEVSVAAISELVRCLGDGEAVKHSHILLEMARGLGVMHLVERVMDSKASLSQDCCLYECALERVVESTEDSNQEALADFKGRLETCRGLKKFLTMPWSLLNSLLRSLQGVPQAGAVLLHLLEFLCRTLQNGNEAFAPYCLPHQDWVLLQALPLVLYLHCFLEKNPPSTESLPNRLLDTCIKLLGKYPVIPGIGDLPLVLALPLQGIQLGRDGARKVLYNPRVNLEKKAMADWELSYSIHVAAGQAQEAHNTLCEDLVHFVREAEEWDQMLPVPIRVCDAAVELVCKLLSHLSLWHCKILNLHAWRMACGTHAEPNALHEGSQSFRESDLSHVINLMCCLKGIAVLFRKSWTILLSKLQEKAQQVCKTFLALFLKKVGEGCDPKIQKLVDVLRRIGGSMMIAESKGLSYGTGPDTGTDFDSGAQGSLESMKCLLEELITVDESLQPKQRFGGFMGKGSSSLCIGAIKDCRDCLKEIYVLEVILEAQEHLQQISVLPSLCFSEMWFEAAGSIQRPKNGSSPLQLAGSAMAHPSGVSMDTVLCTLNLYEDGSVAALHSFQVQHLYYELREDALFGLNKAVDVMVQKAVAELKSLVCKDVLNFTGYDPKSPPPKSNYRHDVCFETPMLRIAGCQVNLSSVFTKRANHVFRTHLQDVLGNLLDAMDPTMLQDVCHSIQILRLVHSSFVRQIPISSWSEIWKSGVGDAFLSPLSRIICSGVFENSTYMSFLNEFHRMRVKTCPRQVSSAGHMVSTTMQCFGLIHLQSVKKLLGRSGLEGLVEHILGWMENQVDFESLPKLGDLLVTNKDDTLGRSRISFGDLLAGMLENVKPLHREYGKWILFLKKLESLGNSLVFLRFLDSMDDAENGPLLEDVEEWLGPPATAATSKTEIGCYMRYMDQGVIKVKEQLMALEGDTKRNQYILTSLSVLFFWGAYVSENEKYGEPHIGDGFLWCLRLLVRLLGQDTAWESTNWASALNHASTLDMSVGGKRSALDVRTFQYRIQQWLAVWDNVGLVLNHVPSAGELPDATVHPTRDPDLVGFFGDAGGLGVSKLPQVPSRRTPPSQNRSGWFSPQQTSIYSSPGWGPGPSSEKSRPVSTEPYRHRAVTKSALLSPRYARRYSSEQEGRPESRLSYQGSGKSHKRLSLSQESRKFARSSSKDSR